MNIKHVSFAAMMVIGFAAGAQSASADFVLTKFTGTMPNVSASGSGVQTAVMNPVASGAITAPVVKSANDTVVAPDFSTVTVQMIDQATVPQVQAQTGNNVHPLISGASNVNANIPFQVAPSSGNQLTQAPAPHSGDTTGSGNQAPVQNPAPASQPAAPGAGTTTQLGYAPVAYQQPATYQQPAAQTTYQTFALIPESEMAPASTKTVKADTKAEKSSGSSRHYAASVSGIDMGVSLVGLLAAVAAILAMAVGYREYANRKKARELEMMKMAA